MAKKRPPRKMEIDVEFEHLSFAEIGECLWYARQQKGQAIETIAEKTRISPRLLLALEDGQLEAFAAPLYAVSFARSYASQLGLAGDACAARIRDIIRQPEVSF